MTNIEIRINGAAAVKGKQDGLLTAGMVGATVRFSFDGLWDGLSKTAVFKCGAMVRDVIGVEDTARIPTEVLCPDTELYVGVEGRSGDGAVVIPTVWVRAAYVYPGANASGDPSTDPTLPVWAQMQAMIGDPSKLHTADKSSLVAAINEALRSGGGAVDEDTVAQLVAEYLEANPPVVTETDPTVPDWAKQSEKPKYTADEVGALSQGELQAGINLALEQAKTSGVFDGAPGKSAYQYALDGGYTGTEDEFAQKLAADGVGASTMMRELFRISMEEDAVLRVKTTADGIPFQDLKLDKVKIVLRAPKTEANVNLYLHVIIGGTDFVVSNYDTICNNQDRHIHVINCDRFADKTWELTRRKSRMYPTTTI